VKRRAFITGVASAAVWPVVTSAAGKRPRVAVLTLLSLEDRGGRIAAFVAGLVERGLIPGQTVDLDYRYAYGDAERLRSLAQELIALAPDVIFAGKPSTARAVKALAPALPIVCPVLTERLPDLFASYARPGGSVTGVAGQVEDLNKNWSNLRTRSFPASSLWAFSSIPLAQTGCWLRSKWKAAHTRAG
jgi:ABC-type uncharacterized transport system substrate-binding protein